MVDWIERSSIINTAEIESAIQYRKSTVSSGEIHLVYVTMRSGRELHLLGRIHELEEEIRDSEAENEV